MCDRQDAVMRALGSARRLACRDWRPRQSPGMASTRVCRLASGEDFGEARLGETLRSSAGEPAEAIVARIFEAIDDFAGKAPQFDDITVIAFGRK